MTPSERIVSMGGRVLGENEWIGGRTVAAVLGGELLPLDGPTAPDGTPDFQIDLSDGRRVILDVTAATKDRTVKEAIAFNNDWSAPELHSDWVVRHVKDLEGTETVYVKELVERLKPILVELEGSETPEVIVPLGGVHPHAVEGLSSLGIQRVQNRGPRQDESGGAILFIRSSSTSGDPGEINRVAQERAEAKADSLSKQDGDEHHVFVWFDSTQPAAELALHAGTLPGVGPELPAGVDAIWVTNYGPPVGGTITPGRLLRTGVDGGWLEVQVPHITE
jgi:hypothetical protein